MPLNFRPCVLAGDFNSLRRLDYSDERWQHFIDHDKLRSLTPKHSVMDLIEGSVFTDCFVREGVCCMIFRPNRHQLPVPQCTTWSGRRIDYILLNEAWNYPIQGCYVYHSAVSDHVPVIMDFQTVVQ